jgi:ribose 1,5-bisphosphate isomerase
MGFKEDLEKIKNLKIQGATAIAKKGIMFFAKYVAEGKNMKKDADYAKKRLMNTRSTEPMLFNAMDYVIKNAKTPNEYLKYAKKFIKIKEEGEKIIAETGAKLVKNGMNIFTHCHSSSVFRVLKKAKEQGKKFNIVCFETRPLFQGRLTAKQLTNIGIRTTLTVDSAMTESFEVFPSNLVLVGCDAITKTFFVNKIGTDTLAHIAGKHKVPFYVCGETYKYTDHLRIEERPSSEVWPNHPKGLNIWNPAFDTINIKHVKGFITEKGILKTVECSKL